MMNKLHKIVAPDRTKLHTIALWPRQRFASRNFPPSQEYTLIDNLTKIKNPEIELWNIKSENKEGEKRNLQAQTTRRENRIKYEKLKYWRNWNIETLECVLYV